MQAIVRGMIYLWTLPTTALGLVLALLTVLTGGRVRIVDGVLEVWGGASTFVLRRITALALEGGASAMTLGHVVVGRNPQLLDATRAHERVHVRQCQRWGPFFVPVYILGSLAAWVRGGRPYEDNFLEREAWAKSS